MENEIFQQSNVAKAYIRLSIPLVCSLVVTLIYNLADTFFVAQTNDTNIVAGVSLGMPVFTMLMALGNIFGQGGSSLVSRLLGQRDEEGVRRASAFCFYAAILVGVVVGVLMLVFRVPMLQVLGANTETFPHASEYYVYLAIGAPAVVLSFVHSSLLRSEGLSKESMAGTILGALVNIVLDPIFISGLGWGAGGAAIASVIGYVVSDVFLVFIVLRRSHILSILPSKCRLSRQRVLQILSIGVPAAIVNLTQSASAVLMNQFLLPYGNDRIAAMGIALKVSMIALLLLTGFAFGGQPLFGYYYGAGDKMRLAEVIRFCFGFISVLALVLTAGIVAAAPLLMRGFMDTDSIVAQGTLMLRWQVITMLFVGIVLLITILFQSTGKATGAFILSLSRQGVIFLLALIVGRQLAGYTGILAAQAISDAITAVIALALFRVQLLDEIRTK